MTRTLTVIAPVFEEADSISAFHAELKRVLVELEPEYSHRILYVCDPGTDGTEYRLRAIAENDVRTSVIVFSRRFGHQAALLAGMDHSSADATIMMDCDLQHPPSVIPQMIRAFEQGYDIVHTVRAYEHQVSWAKRTTSNLYYQLLQFLADTQIRENAADFRLISRRVTALFRSSIRERNQFLRGLFVWVGFRQTDVHFTAPARVAGRTKYSLTRMVRFAVAGIISFSKKPLRYSIYAGILTAALGMILVVVTAIQWMLGSNFPAGWTTLLAVTTFLGGVQLVFLGVIGEYIASIFDEVKHRPIYIQDYILNEANLEGPQKEHPFSNHQSDTERHDPSTSAPA